MMWIAIMVVEHPNARTGYLVSAHARKILEDPFIVETNGEPLSCASRPALRIF